MSCQTNVELGLFEIDLFQCTRDKIGLPSSNKFYEVNMNSEWPNAGNRDLLKIFNTFISDTHSLFKNEEISLRKFVLFLKTKTLQSYQ